MSTPAPVPTFWLGTHRPNWLAKTDVPLMVSRRTLATRKTLPQAQGPWVLDSGGFTELNLYGRWETDVATYVSEVSRIRDEVGHLEWCAPMDWMCEPSVREKTGLTVAEHQSRTTTNFLELRQQLGETVIPVVQGWERDDYLRHIDGYEAAGVDLTAERVVGAGSVCRRNSDGQIGAVLRTLYRSGLSVHAFGVKGTAFVACADVVTSADSLAWSATARLAPGPMLHGCTHKRCANCFPWAMTWRERTVRRVEAQLSQSTLEIPA